MSKHSKIGIKGEQTGYTLLNTNWRAGKKEVDIIALHGETLVIAEVKTRSANDRGFPEDAVTVKKRQLLKQAADAYCAQFPQYGSVRFDIVSIWLEGGQVKEIVHFEEAFH